MPDADVQRAVDGAREGHDRLIRSIQPLTDAQARGRSLLPGWSVGHVLTHLARNADSHVRMLRAAIAGEVTSQYDGGHERRAADIEAGAGRPASELVADVADSAATLQQAWADMTPQAWDGHGVNAAGEAWPCVSMPFHRWREVEIHHADLGLGYSPADWPAGYVQHELAIALRLLPERLDDAGRRGLLAWLLGRSPQPGDPALTPWQARPTDYLR